MVIKSNRYIIPCATAKIPRKPHVQEIFCNETGQITQHSFIPPPVMEQAFDTRSEDI